MMMTGLIDGRTVGGRSFPDGETVDSTHPTYIGATLVANLEWWAVPTYNTGEQFRETITTRK